MLQSEALSGVVFTVKIYFTRMLDPVPEESYKSMHSAVEITPGRPPITAMIDSSVNRAAALQNPSGVAVMVCGPTGLVESVSKAAWSIDGYRRYAVGGVELHQEYVSRFLIVRVSQSSGAGASDTEHAIVLTPSLDATPPTHQLIA